jgi:hypothetical protein
MNWEENCNQFLLKCGATESIARGATMLHHFAETIFSAMTAF